MKMKNYLVMFFVFCMVLVPGMIFAQGNPYELKIDPGNPKYFLYNGKPIFLVGSGNVAGGTNVDIFDTGDLDEFLGYGINQFIVTMVPNSALSNFPYDYSNPASDDIDNNWGGWDDAGFWTDLKNTAEHLRDNNAVLVVCVFSTPARKGNKYWYKDEYGWHQCQEPCADYYDTMWYTHLWNEDNGGPIENWDDDHENRGVGLFYEMGDSNNFLFSPTADPDDDHDDTVENYGSNWQKKSQFRQEQLLAKVMKELDPAVYPNVAVVLQWETSSGWGDAAKTWACRMVRFLKEVRDQEYNSSDRPIGLGSWNSDHVQYVINNYGYSGSDTVFKFVEGYNLINKQIQDNTNGTFPFIFEGYHPRSTCYDNTVPCNCIGSGQEELNVEGTVDVMSGHIQKGMNTSVPFPCYWYENNSYSSHCSGQSNYDPENDVKPEVTRYVNVVRAIMDKVQSWDYEPGTITDDIPEYEDDCIVVKSPDGGEELYRNTTKNITWAYWGFSGNIKITLWQNSSLLGTIVDNLNPSSGSYAWTVGQYGSSTAPAGTGYTIKIEAIGLSVSDTSDAAFEILAPSLTVTSPNGGEDLGTGTNYNITWTHAGLSNDIKITLWQNDSLVGTIVDNLDPSPGSYTWTVGQYSGGTAANGSGYKIKIKEKTTTVADLSDAAFDICTPDPSITVTSPNGGEEWGTGTYHRITWSHQDLTYDIKITLWKDGSLVGTIVDNLDPSPGFYSWKVGEYGGGTAANGSGYKIKIKEIGTAVADTSNAAFDITTPDPSLTVTSPNGSESWALNSVKNITWTHSDVYKLKITLWKDGALVGTIVDNLDPTSGSYAWTVGEYNSGTTAAGTGYTVKIKEIGTAVADTSNASFTITPAE